MKKYLKYGFSGINIKKDIAERFRLFSREVAKSHSETLEVMLNFFKWNNLSPHENLGVKADDTKKRINALIAIIRNIEKNQTLPTKVMLDTLFEGVSQMGEDQDEVVSEEAGFAAAEMISRDKLLEHYQDRYEQMQALLGKNTNHIKELFDRMDYVKGTFGKGYFKLEMDQNEMETFKNNLNHVYHDNSSKT